MEDDVEFMQLLRVMPNANRKSPNEILSFFGLRKTSEDRCTDISATVLDDGSDRVVLTGKTDYSHTLQFAKRVMLNEGYEVVDEVVNLGEAVALAMAEVKVAQFAPCAN